MTLFVFQFSLSSPFALFIIFPTYTYFIIFSSLHSLVFFSHSQTFNASRNNLDNFPAIQFTHLRVLDLSYNLFTEVPTELARYAMQLEELIMDNNPIAIIKFNEKLRLNKLSFRNMPFVTAIEAFSFSNIGKFWGQCIYKMKNVWLDYTNKLSLHVCTFVCAVQFLLSYRLKFQSTLQRTEISLFFLPMDRYTISFKLYFQTSQFIWYLRQKKNMKKLYHRSWIMKQNFKKILIIRIENLIIQ